MFDYIDIEIKNDDKEYSLDLDSSIEFVLMKMVKNGPVQVSSDGKFITAITHDYKIIGDDYSTLILQVDMSTLPKDKIYIRSRDLLFHREICIHDLFEEEKFIDLHEFVEILRKSGKEEYSFLQKEEGLCGNFSTTITLKDNILTIKDVDIDEFENGRKYSTRYSHYLKAIRIDGIMDWNVTTEYLTKLFYILEQAGVEYDLLVEEESLPGHGWGIDVLHIVTKDFTIVTSDGTFHRFEVMKSLVNRCFITNDEDKEVYLPDVIKKHEKEDKSTWFDLDEVPNVWHQVHARNSAMAYSFGHVL